MTEEGLRSNVSVGIQYLAAWLRGSGAVAINNLMEDAATAEISRSQIWQWLRHDRFADDDVRRVVDEEIEKLGDDTVVLPIQNGLGSADAVAEILGEDAVVIGVAEGFGASLVGPAHAHHHGMALVRLGERRGPVSRRVERIADLWRAAGFTVETYDDVDRLVWQKLVCNVSFSGTCALLDLTIGEVLADPDAWHVAAACGSEAHAVAVASGVDLQIEDPVAYVAAFGARIAGARPSLALDLRARRRTEVDVLNGASPICSHSPSPAGTACSGTTSTRPLRPSRSSSRASRSNGPSSAGGPTRRRSVALGPARAPRPLR